MNKRFLGYVVVALFLLAGILEIAVGKIVIGILFMGVAVANVIVFRKLKNLNKD